MIRLKRISWWIKLPFILILIIVGFCFGFKNYLTPTYSGELKLNGLKQTVKIHYDNFGIPHIVAENQTDLYMAYGYAVAQDRMFQIQLQKMIASGRTAEWFGTNTIELDKFIRTMGISYWAKKQFNSIKPKINPQLLTELQAWINGVNECVKLCPKPLEFILLGVNPEPIVIEDVISFSAMMSFSFTKSYYGDLILSELSEKINSDQFNELLSASNVQFGSPIISQQINSLKSKAITTAFSLPRFDSLFPSLDGSQSWVLSPKKSATGYATLANDPHIGFSNPSVWYEAHLKSPSFEIYGHFSPIIPFSLLGSNTEKAWALTMSNSDELDLVKISNTTSLLDRKEIFKIKGSENFEITLKDSAYGPIISSILKTETPIAMLWHYYREDNNVLEAFYDLAHAKNLKDFEQAVKKGRAPGLNVSWADKHGDIGWRVLGYFPKRIKPNWTILDETDVTKFYDTQLSENLTPHAYNPNTGYILSANQRPPFSYDEQKIFGYWDGADRYLTLDHELKASDKISLKQQTELFSLNHFSLGQSRLKKLIGATQDINPALLAKIENWNGQAVAAEIAPTLYYAWIEALTEVILNPVLSSDHVLKFCGTTLHWNFMTYLIDHPESSWWHNNYNQKVTEAYHLAFKKLSDKFGNLNNWKWGSVHTLEFEHPIGKKKPLNHIFNLGPYPVNGGHMIPNAFKHNLCSNTYTVVAGPSTRRLIDFSQPLEGFGILPTGNSGVIFSPYYKDQVELYLKGELRPQILDWDKINALDNVLSLSPN